MVGQARMGIACGSMLSTPFLCGEKVCNEKVSMSYHAMSNDDYTALLWHLNPTEVSYVTSDSHLWDFEERMKNASVSSCGLGQDCTHTKTLPLYNNNNDMARKNSWEIRGGGKEAV